MTDFLRFTVCLEAAGLALLPVSTWFFARLPDRGYVFSKILGLLAITYIVWMAGSLAPLGGHPFVPVAVACLCALAAWSLIGRRTVDAYRSIRTIVLAEEALFLAALVGWSLLRAYVLHPDISHTEQYMDMAFMHASARSHAYPPYDPWMSGHGINYYYFGYLVFGLLTQASGVAPAIAYNLSLSTIAALTIAGAWSLGFCLTRRAGWSLLSPLFVEMLGNWYALLNQLPQGHVPSNTYWWFWQSSRVIGSRLDYTINEFPLFSFVLGDLHPHVMSLPFVLLACASALALLAHPWIPRPSRRNDDTARLVVTALILGSLFTINSWDFPTYGLLLWGALSVRGYLSNATRSWWKRPLVTMAEVTVAAVVLYAPFYLHFRSLAHGIGFVHTHSELGPYLEIFGYPLVLCALLVAGLSVLLRPVVEDEVAEPQAGPEGRLRLAERGASAGNNLLYFGGLAAIVAASVALNLGALMLPLLLGLGALTMLQRVLNAEDPRESDAFALLLIAVGSLVLCMTEIVYIKDSFDLSPSYRMNTVFKFYYQAWVLLMLAGGYAAFRSRGIAGQLFGRRAVTLPLLVVALGAVGGLTETYYGPQASFAFSRSDSLDGMSLLRQSHPSDASVILWLQAHGRDNDVVLEAYSASSGYNADYGRVSVFSGHPTVMGWPDHEAQWRPNDPEIATRGADVQTIYTTPDVARAQTLMRRYEVRYVFVGDTERKDYPATALAKFGAFMHVADRSGTTTLYAW